MTPQSRSLLLGSASLILLSACTPEVLSPVVSGAWARPGAEGMNSAIYFTLQNTTQADVLLEARSDVAEIVQFHQTVIDANGSASMRHQERIDVLGNQMLEFAPGGLHVMLINLHRPLLVGDTIEITLLFREQGEIHARVPVENN